jgi:hypothetical protein
VDTTDHRKLGYGGIHRESRAEVRYRITGLPDGEAA